MDREIERTKIRTETDKQIEYLKLKRHIEVEELRHKNVMKELKLMKEAKITSYRR